MRRKTLLWTLGWLCFLALPIGLGSGCNQAEQTKLPVPDPNAETTAKKLTIAVIPKGTIHEFWKTVHAGAEKAGAELGATVLWKGPVREDDRDAQISVVEDFITRGVSGIVLAPLDDTALRAPVDTAMTGKIPVVIFDSGLKGDNFVSYVSTDNFKAGGIGGEYMAQLLGDKGRVAVLRYSEGSDSTTNRENGFLDALKKHPGIEIVSDNQYAGTTTESAYQAAENLLQRFKAPDGASSTLDGIFVATEPTTFGLLRALQDAGLDGKMHVVGFDSSAKMVEALRAGKLSGFVVQNPMQIGYLAVKTMVEHLQGKGVEKRIDTGATLVNAQNIDTPPIKALMEPALSIQAK